MCNSSFENVRNKKLSNKFVISTSTNALVNCYEIKDKNEIFNVNNRDFLP